MQHILVIADRDAKPSRALQRARELAGDDGRISVVGFVHERVVTADAALREQIAEALVLRRERELRKAIADAGAAGLDLQVIWEKHIADWVSVNAGGLGVDLVVKTGHRSESWHYTPTDWQLLRSCPVPVLIVPERPWRRKGAILAAIDLGTTIRSKRDLNLKVVRMARTLADRQDRALHLAYAVPFSRALRDLGVLEPAQLLADARASAAAFHQQLEAEGLAVDGLHVKAGVPDKVLTSIAADLKAATVVLGCVGRRAVSGRVIGNTAERILRLCRTEVLAIKP